MGEAVVSCLDADGSPSVAEKVMIYPPMSKIGTIDPSLLMQIINRSPLIDKYGQEVNRESAHEQILKATEILESQLIQESQPSQDKKLNQSKSSTRRTDSNFDRFTKNMMSSVGRELGRMITRTITGMWKK